MEFHLPEEIWIKILKFLSPTDLHRNIQCINKYFKRLCSDIDLTSSISFTNEIYIESPDIEHILGRSKPHLCELSLRNCYWMPSRVFRSLPSSRIMHSLDFIGCNISGRLLNDVLLKYPALRSLAFSVSCNIVHDIIIERKKPIRLKLKRLHIQFCGQTCPNGLQMFCEKYILGCLISSEEKQLDSLMIDISENFGVRNFETLLTTLSVLLMPRESLHINGVPNSDPIYNPRHCPNSIFCSLLSRYKLHTDMYDQHRSSMLLPTPFNFGIRLADIRPVEDFSRLRFLSLNVCATAEYNGDPYSRFFGHCKNLSFPNLQCLIVNLQSTKLAFDSHHNHDLCFYDIIYSILCKGSYPELRCLNVDSICTLRKSKIESTEVPVEMLDFNANILKLKHLEEINFRGVPLKPHVVLQLLIAQKDLKKLHSLSVMISSVVDSEIPTTPNEVSIPYVITGAAKRARVSRCSTSFHSSVLEVISSECVNLKNLELTGCFEIPKSEEQGRRINCFDSNILLPVCDMKRLERLTLSTVPVTDFSFLRKIFTSCTNLICLTLSHVGTRSRAGYQHELPKGLKYLTQLKVLRIQHRYLDLNQNLFDSVTNCKKLEKFVVISHSESYAHTVDGMQDLILSCTRLHVMVISSGGATSEKRKKMRQFVSNLRNRRCKMLFYFYRNLIGAVPHMHPVAKELMDFDNSSVANYTAISYPCK